MYFEKDGRHCIYNRIDMKIREAIKIYSFELSGIENICCVTCILENGFAGTEKWYKATLLIYLAQYIGIIFNRKGKKQT